MTSSRSVYPSGQSRGFRDPPTSRRGETFLSHRYIPEGGSSRSPAHELPPVRRRRARTILAQAAVCEDAVRNAPSSSPRRGYLGHALTPFLLRSVERCSINPSA